MSNPTTLQPINFLDLVINYYEIAKIKFDGIERTKFEKLDPRNVIKNEKYNRTLERLLLIFNTIILFDRQKKIPEGSLTGFIPLKAGGRLRADCVNKATYLSTGILIGSGGNKEIKLAIHLSNSGKPIVKARASAKKLKSNKMNSSVVKNYKIANQEIEKEFNNYNQFVAGSSSFIKIDCLNKSTSPNITGEKTNKADEKSVFFMDYYEKGSLSDIITTAKDRRNFSTDEILSFYDLVRNILEGLVYLEANNLFHGDLKPANILVRTNPETGKLEAKIADLALLEKLGNKVKKANPGTYSYLSPEYCLGRIKQREVHLTNQQLRIKDKKDNDDTVISWDAFLEIKDENRKTLKQAFFLTHSTKVDLWAIGLTLYEFCNREEERPSVLPDVDDFEGRQAYFYAMSRTSQETMDEIFDVKKGAHTLQGLIQWMLKIDHTKRPSARQCLDYFDKIEKTEDNFFFELPSTYCPFYLGDSEEDSQDVKRSRSRNSSEEKS